jgi:peptidoglycan/xylan/chitin deacetylase (PgdA/CDA1 family)
LGPLLLIGFFSMPMWRAAARFTSLARDPSDSLRVPILVYHSVAPTHAGQTAEQRLLDVDTTIFRQQMSYLAANRYTVISLSTLIDALQGHGSVPPRAVVITFDDGWLTQYQHALPILEQMRFTATFFVITAQVGRGSMYMNLEELTTLQRAGMTIASHTRTHPNLTQASDSQLHDEVFGSRQDLQKMLGGSVDLFAYPYGAWDRRVAAAVEGAGYRAARAYPGGAWNGITDRFALRSVPATNDMDAFERDLGLRDVVSISPLRAPRQSAGQSPR